jgi:hypothetical protein
MAGDPGRQKQREGSQFAVDAVTGTYDSVTVAQELGLPVYDDVSNADQVQGRLVYATGSGTSSEGIYKHDGSSYAQVGGASSEWQEDGNGNVVPIDGETVGDGTTTADHQSVSTDETQTKTIGSGDHHYAGVYDGANADARLDNAVSAASEGDVIYLENAEYTVNRTISKLLRIEGTQGFGGKYIGSAVSGEWTLDDRNIAVFYCGFVSGSQITIEKAEITVADCWVSTVSGEGHIQINNDSARLYNLARDASVTFASGTTGGIIDSCSRISVTDNGTNTVGDIA